jgi:hypothetical protein
MTGKPVIQGVEMISSAAELSILPNPASDYIIININDQDYYSVEIHDVTGKKIFSANVEGKGITIDLRGYPGGMYFVSCKSKNQVSSGKFIKY